ncbi:MULTISPECIES: hypothetical protein [Sphingobacterium]|uniref:Uncharacterized protein n=1 Tax=Sphingobacterium athyrii TaxID=2152717 RepID=A0A363NYH6_9SPHI|nr:MULTISPECIES: hypothetical protein [Sphingobacterium]PUV25849.1 hypothetical protein DCO56_02430 [Sphingobacterium athyrii]QIH33275.1 hypothetical protein G6053_10450 [Sphingobacterium sp. DR205]
MFPKFPRTTWIIFFILTVTITLLFSKCESPSDGNDVLGFPFPFYTYLGGKRYPEPPDRTYFNGIYLLLNLVVYFGIACLLSYSIKKIRK